MSEILIGQSYYLKFDAKLWAAMQPYPPLGALYAASLLRQQGYDIALFDAMLATSEQEWEDALERHQPRFAVLYEDNFNYLSKMCLLRMREAAFTMIEQARRHGCTVIVCGADATDHSAEYIHHGAYAHFVLQGEGEYTLLELLDSLTGKSAKSLEQIQSLVFVCTGASEPTYNKRRADIRDLDSLPFPAWDLINVERYRKLWMTRHGFFSMNVVSTRGCPYHCNWCAKPIWGQRYNSRSAGNVAAELQWLAETYHPDRITFMDDIFGLKPGWLEDFAECIEHLPNARLPYKCLSRADLLTRAGEVERLNRSGCRTVWLGAESGSQKVLDAMEKGTAVSQIHAACRMLHDAGIEVGFFIQFGYPGETHKDIELTLQMVRECMPDDIGISVSYPMPGTRFYNAVRSRMGSKQNWQDSNDLAMLYDGAYGTAFYRQLHVVLHHEFRARRHFARLTGHGGQRDRQIKVSHLHSLAASGYHAFRLPFARLKLQHLAKPRANDV